MAEGDLRDDEVMAALARLLAWPDIARSPQLARFLEYIVGRKLRGDSDSIKAYSIAVDVFSRPADFDPQADPIVRVQARRLRALLDQFYEGDGASEPIRIDLPVGRYVPEFIRWSGVHAGAPVGEVSLEPEKSVPARGGLPFGWFALAIATTALAILAYASSTWGPGPQYTASASGLIHPPSVLVTEFQNLTGDRSDLDAVSGLAVELVTDLGQFETIDVGYDATDGAAESDYEFILSGIVRRSEGGLQYSAILTETGTGAVVWNKAVSFDSDVLAQADRVDQVSGTFGRVLGSPRGPLHQKARALVNSAADIRGGETLYLCRVMFDMYRERGSVGAGERARNCFAALPEDQRLLGPALAADAILSAELTSAPVSGGLADPETLQMAENMMAVAVSVAPTSAFVWEQRARLHELAGQHDAAEAAYSSSLQLNPASTDALAARARHLAFLGRHDAAAVLSSRAMDGAPEPPPWYFAVPALQALQNGAYSTAVDYAATYSEADRELGPIFAIMAGQRLADVDIVNRYLPRVLDLSSFRARGVITQLRRRISDEVMIGAISTALRNAGVPAIALNSAF